MISSLKLIVTVLRSYCLCYKIRFELKRYIDKIDFSKIIFRSEVRVGQREVVYEVRRNLKIKINNDFNNAFGIPKSINSL